MGQNKEKNNATHAQKYTTDPPLYTQVKQE